MCKRHVSIGCAICCCALRQARADECAGSHPQALPSCHNGQELTCLSLVSLHSLLLEHFSLRESQHGSVQAAAGGLPLGVPITELALLNTFTLLLWQLKAVQQEDSTSTTTGQAVIDPAEGLGERVVTFSVHLESIFEGSEDLQRLQDCIFRIQADLFLVFSYSKLQVSLALHTLICSQAVLALQVSGLTAQLPCVYTWFMCIADATGLAGEQAHIYFYVSAPSWSCFNSLCTTAIAHKFTSLPAWLITCTYSPYRRVLDT